MAQDAAAAGAGAGDTGIDENLYSRQIGVYGLETMGKLITLKTLIVGLKGVGIEAAKNLILAGPRQVTVFDPSVVTAADLGCNFYCEPDDVGNKSRAAASLDQLRGLNPHVRVNVLEVEQLTTDVLAQFNVVVFTGDLVPAAQLVEFDEFCRAQTPAIGFITADVRGVTSRVFVDFGDRHIVHDDNGEAAKQGAVVTIEKGEQTVILTDDKKRNGLEPGDHVVFYDVEGMTALNDGTPRKVLSSSPYSFTIECDSRDWPEFEPCSATYEQKKIPKEVAFASLATRKASPLPSDDPMGMLLTADLGKFGRPQRLHWAYEAIDAFVSAHGRLPAVRNAEEAGEVATEAAKLASAEGEEATALEQVVLKTASTAAVELAPLCAFVGGVVAQEVVKFTGKFSPIRQYFYLDAFEVLPDEATAAAAGEFTVEDPRYTHLTSILGRTLLGRIRNQKVFLVGAGALGCEFLKNFCMLGVGTGEEGRVTVTDMDNIEVSNLNRQFLFRPENVGAAKSITAAAAARRMNGDLKVEALETPVGTDTEDTFNDAFWSGLSMVVNALDNIKARLYVDGRCVWYRKPLLESGTLGTKANTQVVSPFQTESYGDSSDPPETSIPMCTLKNFPNAIEHCIEWARDLFQGAFTSAVQDAASFADNPNDFLAKIAEEGNDNVRRTKLQGVRAALDAAKDKSFARCVRFARLLFNTHFSENILQLLHKFPKDYVSKETGQKFWTGGKRAPDAIEFDISDDLHRGFIAHCAALVADNFGVALPDGYDTAAVLQPLCEAVDVPAFVPKDMTIKADDGDDAEEGVADDAAVADQLLQGLQAEVAAGEDALKALTLNPADFEKDDDSNHHIDFIAAASNLRASNYKIRTVPRSKVKLVAGKIIPAIATTTCAVTGLVGIELIKVVMGLKIEGYRNSFINLANNVYSMAEPMPPRRITDQENDPIAMGPVHAYNGGFTPWDRIVYEGVSRSTTVGQLIDMIHEREAANHEGIQVEMISVGNSILFAPMFHRSHEERRDRPLVEVYEEVVAPLEEGRNNIALDLSCVDNECDVTTPPLQVIFEG